jgi:hypothetical protein
MNANLLPEGWKIGKRIESGSYLGCKLTVAESLPSFAFICRRQELLVQSITKFVYRGLGTIFGAIFLIFFLTMGVPRPSVMWGQIKLFIQGGQAA